MRRIAVISGCPEQAGNLRRRLGDFFAPELLRPDELAHAGPEEFVLVDIDLKDAAQIANLKRWLQCRPHHGQAIFGVDRGSRHDSIQAYAIGATDVLPRPIDPKMLLHKFCRRPAAMDTAIASARAGGDMSICVSSLQDMFASAVSGKVPDVRMLGTASTEIVERIDEDGLGPWLDVIRKHHSQTFQHCLIVTAVAVAFGRLLGFSCADKRRLASAGLLHDLGKARVPVAILEKPTPLCEEEVAVMRTHPELGIEALRDTQGLHPEMLDVVLHHHEYLDGSGYPHGLHGNEISDLVRTVTIADIYGALIEQRPYRAPMSGTGAYQVLREMGAKLDTALVREFRVLAQGVA
jgi:putative nucleotidyltransferase with HDIG domain